MLEVRQESTEDFYNTVKDWWNNKSILYEGKRISYPIIPIPILPKTVFIVSNDGEDLYCMFFYHTDSRLAWIAYPTSNPFVEKAKREGALDYLTLEVEKYAKEEGYYLLFTTSPVKPVQDCLMRVGFVVGDETVNQYYKQLKPN